MIDKVAFTVKGDYNEMTLCRDEGSRWIEMQFHRHCSVSFARFKLEDLKMALAILDCAGEEE